MKKKNDFDDLRLVDGVERLLRLLLVVHLVDGLHRVEWVLDGVRAVHVAVGQPLLTLLLEVQAPLLLLEPLVVGVDERHEEQQSARDDDECAGYVERVAVGRDLANPALKQIATTNRSLSKIISTHQHGSLTLDLKTKQLCFKYSHNRLFEF